jgi:glycosyltransferase involved in cell wall biosynthesis
VFKNKTAIVSVINDLVTDQRVYRTCEVLHELGYDITVVGRQLSSSPPLPQWAWKAHRMRLLFTKGPLFYLFFNVRLFFFLLTRKRALLIANDLDTLLPNYLVAKLKRAPLVYDSHELFCDVPELLNNPLKRRIWQWLEKQLVPHVHHCITVNESIATLFHARYHVPFHVVRNVSNAPEQIVPPDKASLGFAAEWPLLILQGAGINAGRGAEELILAMHHVAAGLLIIGGGDVWHALEALIQKERLSHKIKMIRRLPRHELFGYTRLAAVGLSIDKPIALNYELSLPNKLFDYIQAGTPVLASNMVEVAKIVNGYGVGRCIDQVNPETIANALHEMLQPENQARYRAACEKAAVSLNWNQEKYALKEVLLKAVEAPSF